MNNYYYYYMPCDLRTFAELDIALGCGGKRSKFILLYLVQENK